MTILEDDETTGPDAFSLTELPYLELGMSELATAWENMAPAGSSGSIEKDLEAATDPSFMSWLESLGTLLRQVMMLGAFAAGEVDRRSNKSLGADGFARKMGFRNAADLIHDVLGLHPGDGKKLVKVGVASTGATWLSGERGPAATALVAEAMKQGTLGLAAAYEIVQFHDRLVPHVNREQIEKGEKLLVESAPDLTLDGLKRSIARVEGHVFPDGVEPRTDEQRESRSLTLTKHGDGSLTIKGKFDPVSAAPIRTALEGYATHHIRTNRGENLNAGDSPDDGLSDTQPEPVDVDLFAQEGVAFAPTADREAKREGSASAAEISRLLADGLAAISKHALGCDKDAVPGSSTNVMVRVPVESIMTREVFEQAEQLGEIDGGGVLSAGTARIIAASAGIIPIVLGTKREVLDVGRERRLFSRAQRDALAERDGGCAFCGMPPSMTEAHHIEWWNAHDGSTDLDNGVLLCMTCHHRIHEGWDVVIVTQNSNDGIASVTSARKRGNPSKNNQGAGTVWFIPPTKVDPFKTPRLGGRRRFDPVFRAQHEPSPPPGWRWDGMKVVRQRK